MPKDRKELTPVDTWIWTEDYTPAERSAAWVIEEWLCDEPTLRHLASRWTSRAELFAAYLRRLPTVDPARANFTPYPPVRSDDDRGAYAGRATALRGPTAGRLVPAGQRVFYRTARLYLMESIVHGQRGWMGVGLWRGGPILAQDGRTYAPLRDRTPLRPGYRPMWSRP